MTTRRTTRVALVLSVILFAASLTQDAFCVSGICSDWPGWSILLFGALGHTSWFANPLLGAAWIAALFARRVPALILALAALGLAAPFMFETSVVTNEAGMTNPVTGLRDGYWLWLASMAMAVVAAAFAGKVPDRLWRHCCHPERGEGSLAARESIVRSACPSRRSGRQSHRPSSCWLIQTCTVFDSRNACAVLRFAGSRASPSMIAVMTSHL